MSISEFTGCFELDKTCMLPLTNYVRRTCFVDCGKRPLKSRHSDIEQQLATTTWPKAQEFFSGSGFPIRGSHGQAARPEENERRRSKGRFCKNAEVLGGSPQSEE
jgi:hypothetical protein